MSTAKNKITKETTLFEILKYPKSKKILAKHNLPCLNCPIAAFEMKNLKINQICEMYNINLKELLKELNS